MRLNFSFFNYYHFLYSITIVISVSSRVIVRFTEPVTSDLSFVIVFVLFPFTVLHAITIITVSCHHFSWSSPGWLLLVLPDRFFLAPSGSTVPGFFNRGFFCFFNRIEMSRQEYFEFPENCNNFKCVCFTTLNAIKCNLMCL